MNMKFNNKLIALALGAMSLSFAACDNQDIEFPDHQDGIAVYFPYQKPVRTLVLGTDEVDTQLDKQHKCKISATMGGSVRGRDVVVTVAIDPTLVQNVTDEAGNPIKVMPAEYYSLSSDKLFFNGGLTGSIEVQLTDAFFADPLSVANSYVIPLVMTNQIGADRVLSGEYEGETAPARLNGEAWKELPKDYVLYCVKYKSKYDAYFSRCGKYTVDGKTVQIPDESSAKYEGHFDPVVDGADCNTQTISLNEVKYNVNKSVEGVEIVCDLKLTFDGSDNCFISSMTEGVTVTGSGKFTPNGAIKAWGDKDRDLLTLDFTVTKDGKSIKCVESLVWKRSGVPSIEEFATKYVAQ